MADTQLDIERFVLRMPGLTDSEARGMAAAVIERLGNTVDAASSMSRAHVTVRLTLESGLPREDAADKIAAAILGALR